MDQQNVIVLGCLTFAVAITAFILWGPSPRPRKRKGQIVGLVNLGSTCFLNTLLQALASCSVFIHWLSQQKQDDNSLTASLFRVLLVLNGGGTGEDYTPIEVLTALKRHGWVVSSGEQDAHELFNIIVSTLQEESCNAQKVGSLSDALLSSDSLSQTSEVMDMSDYSEVPENFESVKDKDKLKKLMLGEGDDSHSRLPLVNCSSDAITNYEDAVDKLNHGDSISHSSTVVFYSLECDSSLHDNVDNCGDIEESPVKYVPESPKNKESEADSKLTSIKRYLQKFKTSQESFRGKSPDFSGYYDRIAGCSPCIVQTDVPPFQGLLTSNLQCSECGYHSSVRYDTFDSVSLPLGDNFCFPIQKLQDLLKKFVKTESIPDVECEKCCKKTTAFKTLNFGKLPQCLCLRIARTAWHTYSRTPTKREDYVDFPEYLPMDDYTVSAKLKKTDGANYVEGENEQLNNAKDKKYKHLYRLKSVVVHLGGVNSGHFLTYRRGALNSEKRHRVGKLAGACMDSQRWYLTSDDTVKLSTLYEAMDSAAYMLFYEKCFPESLQDNKMKVILPDSNITEKHSN